MRRFDGRVALLTGAASGIGRATAERLAAEGAALWLVDVQREALDHVLASVRAAGADAEAAVADVASEREVEATVAACVARFGKLDVLCNVAAVLRFDHFHEIRTADWARVLAVNLTGTFFTCRAAIPHLLATAGNVVNVASTAAVHGQPWAGAYAASKGGVLAMTYSIAIDYAKQGLRANAILPCDIATPMFHEFRLPAGADAKLVRRVMAPRGSGRPADVAGVIAMVASDDGAHMTGAAIRVDGGAWA
jgi:NAD(P)-dependent dehydrogenase (short-subunit alcohol dehydrogenase family)